MAALQVDAGIGGLSAAGSAGGGNVFNMAPLFGSIYSAGGVGGSSNGDNGSTAASSSAAKGSPLDVTSLPTSVAKVATSVSNYLPIILAGAIAVAVAFVAIFALKALKK